MNVRKYVLATLPLWFATGCDVFGSDNVPSEISAFVARYPLPDSQPIDVSAVMAAGGEDIDLFSVSFGPPMDCPSGCYYETAYGLRRGTTVGWLEPPVLEEQDPAPVYDFGEADTELYEPAFFTRLEATDDWVYRYAFLPVLASDPDVPRDVLLRVTRGLYEYIQPSLGRALLANAAVVTDRELLALLAELPVFRGDAYSFVRAEAQELLATLEDQQP